MPLIANETPAQRAKEAPRNDSDTQPGPRTLRGRRSAASATQGLAADPPSSPIGTEGYHVWARDERQGKLTLDRSVTRPLRGVMLSKYQKEADRAGVQLDTALRTLPRGGIDFTVKYSQRYQSCGVSVWLEETFPSYERSEAREIYQSLAERVEVILEEGMAEIRKSSGI